MVKKRHGPRGDCGCCLPPCSITCPDSTTVNLTEVEWDLTFPSELVVWKFDGSLFWQKWVLSLTALNGTYVITRDNTNCEWSVYSQSETVQAVVYIYPNSVITPPSGEPYNCPDLSAYTSTVSYNINAFGFANWNVMQFILSTVGVFITFNGYGAGSNNNSPCETATINWNSLDNYPVDSRCTGITSSTATVVLTPTIS